MCLTHLIRVVTEAVRPNQIEIVLKFLLRLVLLLLHLLEHGLEIHGILNDYTTVSIDTRRVTCIYTPS